MKDWKDIIYEDAVESGLIKGEEDWVSYNTESFPIDDKIIDKVPRIPIKFNTQFVLQQSLEYRIKQSIFVKEL